MALLHKDIKEIEITRSLRRLGNIQVMEWDFRTVFPAINKLAHHEVDIIGLVKRTAEYKVLDWDFRRALAPETQPAATAGARAVRVSPEVMQAVSERLKTFLQYVVVELIDEPGHAQIKVQQIAADVLRFKLVLVKRDVAMLIGREGHTAAAIRQIIKAVAALHGVQVLLQIHAHEDER